MAVKNPRKLFVNIVVRDLKASMDFYRKLGFYAISCASRAEVDELVKTAVAAGGAHAMDSQDHGLCTSGVSTTSTAITGR